jgi:hypothetical protein
LAGKIKEMIDTIIQERAKGNPAIAEMTKAKFILKGVNPNKCNPEITLRIFFVQVDLLWIITQISTHTS